MNQSIGRQVVVIIVLVLLLIVVGMLSAFAPRHYRGEEQVASDTNQQPVVLPVPVPPPRTKHMDEVLANSKGYAQFINYTDNGFEPANVTIKRGEAVRFTNNSSHDMWIMSSGGDGGVYPASEDSCGQSAFDTCIAFPRNEIWEFTFDVAGTWVYRNNAHKDDVGVINVK